MLSFYYLFCPIKMLCEKVTWIFNIFSNIGNIRYFTIILFRCFFINFVKLNLLERNFCIVILANKTRYKAIFIRTNGCYRNNFNHCYKNDGECWKFRVRRRNCKHNEPTVENTEKYLHIVIFECFKNWDATKLTDIFS